MCGGDLGLYPVISIDGHSIGDGKVGSKLQEVDINMRRWGRW